MPLVKTPTNRDDRIPEWTAANHLRHTPMFAGLTKRAREKVREASEQAANSESQLVLTVYNREMTCFFG